MFRSVRLPGSVKGKLYLHSMPGRYETFEEAEYEIVKHKIDEIVCLATSEEIIMKSPNYANALKFDKNVWRQRMFPILNFGVPTDRQAFLKLVNELACQLLSGDRLLIHCGGGIGRSGTLAIGLLISLGMGSEKAREAVASAHSYPETTVQERLLDWMAKMFEQRISDSEDT